MTQYAPPTRILLISHPATREQKSGVFPADELLDEETLAKISVLPAILPSNARLLSAPEQRTQQTAGALGWSATIDPALADCDFGRWRGASLEAIQEEDLHGLSAWLADVAAAPHGGESFRGLMVRVGKWLDAQRGLGTILAVTHASVVRAAVVHALESPEPSFFRLDIGPMTVTELRQAGDSWRVRSVAVPWQSVTFE